MLSKKPINSNFGTITTLDCNDVSNRKRKQGECPYPAKQGKVQLSLKSARSAEYRLDYKPYVED